MSENVDTNADRQDSDGIEPGKRLIRVGGDRGLSLADRFSDFMLRLSWRTPIHALRLKGRHPLKLIAVTDDPFLGNVRRGEALLEGKILFRGESHEIKTLDPLKNTWSKAFTEHFHSFAWLRDLSTVSTRQQAIPIAELLTRKWLAAHSAKVTDPAWRADLWGRRMQFWTAHAPLILSSTDLVYRSDILHAIARGARHLDQSADRVPAGSARIAAWCGVLTAGLMIPGGDPRRSFGEAGLQRALAASITKDGGIVGRSPMALLDAIQLLSLLREAYHARRINPPEFLNATLTRMVSALLAVCHGDHGLASWQGGLPLSGDIVDQVIEASGIRTRPLRQAHDWGYQRLSHQGTIVMIDAAPPPLSRLLPNACASTLAFEFSDGDERIVVNCGGARTADLRMPDAYVQGLRSTVAHSTLSLNESNSTLTNADGSLGKGVVEMELSRSENDKSSRIEASHDGYVSRYGMIHRRSLTLGSDGRDLRGEDSLIPARKRGGKSGPQPFVLRFHLHPSVEVTPTANNTGAMLRTKSGSIWQFRAGGAELSVEDSVWVNSNGIPRETLQLVLTGITEPGGSSISWLFHRARKGS